MSDLERLVSAQYNLIQALDRGDVAGIESATSVMKQILATLGSEASTEQLRPRIEHALRQGDAARARVNFLADRTCQRLDRLARYRHFSAGPLYNVVGQIGVSGR